MFNGIDFYFVVKRSSDYEYSLIRTTKHMEMHLLKIVIHFFHRLFSKTLIFSFMKNTPTDIDFLFRFR